MATRFCSVSKMKLHRSSNRWFACHSLQYSARNQSWKDSTQYSRRLSRQSGLSHCCRQTSRGSYHHLSRWRWSPSADACGKKSQFNSEKFACKKKILLLNYKCSVACHCLTHAYLVTWSACPFTYIVVFWFLWISSGSGYVTSYSTPW